MRAYETYGFSLNCFHLSNKESRKKSFQKCEKIDISYFLRIT